MGKLNIAHHKSYHPYRRDNIERVRRDEEEARLEEAKEEGRMTLADSEARMDLLRQRAGLVEKQKENGDEKRIVPTVTAGSNGEGAALPTTNGHINLFQDLEQSMIASITSATKKTDPKAEERGVKLAPDEKDLKTWYTQRHRDEAEQEEKDDNGKSMREAQRKYSHDPLTSIERQLATRSEASSTQPPKKPRPSHHTSSVPTSSDPSVKARLTRESSERERALALIQRRKKEMEGNATPSTVYGDDVGEGYRDVYNRAEVAEAHRGRERRRDRGWGDDRSGRHRRRDW